MRAGWRVFAFLPRGAHSRAIVAAALAATAVARPTPPLECGSASLDNTMRSLDDARDAGSADLRRAYDVAAALALQHPDDAGVLWRAARAAYDLAETEPTAATKKALLAEAQRHIVAAKTLPGGRSSADVFRWAGIVLQAQPVGTADFIRNAFVVRDDWQAALHIDPADGAAQHLLGRWHLDVADTPSWKRAIATTIFAEPPTVSLMVTTAP